MNKLTFTLNTTWMSAILLITLSVQSMENNDNKGLTIEQEQPLDLSYALNTCPNEIVCCLDGQSLSSLTQVSKQCQEICDAVPTKYLTVPFSQVANHGSEKLINRFINHPDSWMFTSETDEEIFIPDENNDNNAIKIFKRSFGKGLQDFIGNCSIYCISQNNKIARYIFVWKNFEKEEDGTLLQQDKVCINYLNAGTCNKAINTASENCLKHARSPLGSDFSVTEIALGCCHWLTHVRYPWRKFSIKTQSHSAENALKQLGIMMTFLLAAQKNHTAVTYAMLNNSKVIDAWSPDILEIPIHDISYNDNEIKDVAWAELVKRYPDYTKKNAYEVL